MIQKTQINQMETLNNRSIQMDKIRNMIEKAKQETPKGDIKNVLHEIQLKEMPFIR